jgi:hypothetical protein
MFRYQLSANDHQLQQPVVSPPPHHARNRKNTRGTAFVHRTTNCPLLWTGVTGESCQTAGVFVAYSSRVL